MAAGDINSRNVNSAGDLAVISGTIEVDTTARAFAIANDKTNIVSLTVATQDTADKAVLAMPNSDDGTADTKMGTIWVDGEGSGTVQYVAFCTGPF
jgi:hypothetical protein|tara:strand:+ start:39 stop:326 length:288 start_codon:yes stop_codon:yes gene_type:complete